MAIRKYSTPVLFDLDDEGDVTVVGGGTGQGTYITANTTYSEWLQIMTHGYTGSVNSPDCPNPDADYNGDGTINEADYHYYMDNHLYNP